MDAVTLTEASFVFMEGHEIDLVEIHNVVKFLANGLYKSDIYECGDTIVMQFPISKLFCSFDCLCACSNLRTAEWIVKNSGKSEFYEKFVSHFNIYLCLRI